MNEPVDQAFRETRFVETFVLRPQRNRYLSFLRNAKKRSVILDRLNHTPDFDFDRASPLEAEQSEPRRVQVQLRSAGVEDMAWLISDDNDMDGRYVSLAHGVEMIANAEWGTILVCPPKPIAIYKSEECKLYLLR